MLFQGARNSPRRGVHPCRQWLHAFIITYIRVSATSRLVYELFSPKKWPRAQKTDVRSGWMKLGWNTVINFLMLGHFWAGHIETAPWLWPPAWKSRPQEFVLTWKWFLAQGGGAVSGWGWLGVQVQSHPPPLEPPPPPNSNLWPQILWHLQEEEGCSFYNSGWDNNTN